jgi:hypothetical protein
MGEKYVTTAEAATILGFNTGWVAALCRNGLLEATGGGRGVLWLIKRSSVEELAEARSMPVDQEDLVAVAKEIEEDEEAQELAKEKAEDSFRDRVISIARRYGTSVLCVIAGALGHVIAPGNPISDCLIGAGLTVILTKAAESPKPKITKAPTSSPQIPPKTNKRRKK